MQINEDDVTEIAQLAQQVLRCETVSELKKKTVASLDRIFGSHVTMFFADPEQLDRTDQQAVFHGVDSYHTTLFHTRFQSNPYADWAREMRSRWCSAVARPSVRAGDVLNSAFYQDFMRPLHMHHMMAMGLIRGNRYIGLVGMCRPETERDFSAAEIAKAELLAPCLQGALERLVLVEQLREMHRLAESLDDGGAVMLDGGLEILYVNAAAHELLARLRDPLERPPAVGFALPALVHRACVALLKGSSKLQASSSIELEEPSTRTKVSLTLQPLSDDTKGARYILKLAAPTPLASRRDSLRRRGLTLREIDILDAIASGLTNAEVANRLHISFFTVQSHLKSIYQKLDVHNRIGLLSAVATAIR